MKIFKNSASPIYRIYRNRSFYSRFFYNNEQQKSYFEDVGSSMASHLKTRSVIRFRGPDTIKFLQGLVTNDVRKFGEEIGEKTSTLTTPNNLSTSSDSKEEPEASALGWVAGVDKVGQSSTKGNTPLVEANKETDELNYLQWRVEKGVAEGSTEIPKGIQQFHLDF
ncbi:hypothetical protein MKW98_029784 [Papaver atlanticum]|uniref:Uncharacterized protein n=1 Tax=Papaver atlanticum TaxID=357466 RepID=A0AAD4T6Z8_9MAGN|nr:hypothetical protein MKW98_029784 [Papaver atlanticum]